MPRTKLRPHPTSPAAARRFVADVLLNRGFGQGCIEQAMLLTSEVVTSAVLRAETGVEVVVAADHPMVRVEIHGDEVPAPDSRHLDEAARLRSALVEALSEAWGMEDVGGRGSCTWFEMRS